MDRKRRARSRGGRRHAPGVLGGTSGAGVRLPRLAGAQRPVTTRTAGHQRRRPDYNRSAGVSRALGGASAMSSSPIVVPGRGQFGVTANASPVGAGAGPGRDQGFADAVNAAGDERLPGGARAGVSAVKGRRPYMEDEFAVVPSMEAAAGLPDGDGRTSLFAVYDGHGGRNCSATLAQKLHLVLAKQRSFQQALAPAVMDAFRAFDAEYLDTADRFALDDGSTANVVLLRGGRLLVANVGDSRAVLSSWGSAVALSSDHKPNRADEARRVRAAGGRVVRTIGVARVNGVLAMSRAFGDRSLKPVVTAVPELQEHALEEGDEFLIIASDGLWDALSNQEAVDLVHKFVIKLQMGLRAAAAKLTMRALMRGSMDNITAVVVDLRGVPRASADAALTVTGSSGASSPRFASPRRPAEGRQRRGR